MENKNNNMQASENKKSEADKGDVKNSSGLSNNEDVDDNSKEHRGDTAKNIGPNNDVERE